MGKVFLSMIQNPSARKKKGSTDAIISETGLKTKQKKIFAIRFTEKKPISLILKKKASGIPWQSIG